MGMFHDLFTLINEHAPFIIASIVSSIDSFVHLHLLIVVTLLNLVAL
jgi:hypothetical protein